MKESRPRRSIPAFSRDDEISTDAESISDSEEHSSDNSDPKPLHPTKRRPWAAEEDQSLIHWVTEEKKDWNWISRQLDRTPGAVCTRWHTKFQSKGHRRERGA
jgi:hypothetical protein